jgi:F0F1-type ATP synthase alpha subunit
VQRFQDELREHLRTEGSIYKAIRDERVLSDEVQEKLRKEIEKFAQTFAVQEKSLAGAS